MTTLAALLTAAAAAVGGAGISWQAWHMRRDDMLMAIAGAGVAALMFGMSGIMIWLEMGVGSP